MNTNKPKKVYVWVGIIVAVALVAAVVFYVCSNKSTNTSGDVDSSAMSSSEAVSDSSAAVVDSDAASSAEVAANSGAEEDVLVAENDNSAVNAPKEENKEPAPAEDKKESTEQSSAPEQPAAEEVKPKYSDAEIYEKEGKKYSKTESGEEVELSGDNMQKLMEDYQKVQGTGSKEEKEILDRMQVILDNAEKLQ